MAALRIKKLGAILKSLDLRIFFVKKPLPGEPPGKAVEHVRGLKEILSYGIMGVPALLINGQVKAAGQLPTKKMLKNWLIEVNQP